MPIGAFRLNTISKATALTEAYWFNIMSGDGISDKGLKSAVDSSGNIFVAANDGSERGIFLKFDSSGVIQWQTTAPTNFVSRSVAVDSTGIPYFVGSNESINPARPIIYKLNPATGLTTSARYQSSDLAYNNGFYAIDIDSTDVLHLAGRNNSSTGYYNTTHIKYTTGLSIVSTSACSYTNGTTTYPQPYGISAYSSTVLWIVGQQLIGGNYSPYIYRSSSTNGTLSYGMNSSTGLSSSGNNIFRDCVWDNSSTVYAVGGNTVAAGGANCVYIVKYTGSSTPEITWQRAITSIAGQATGVARDTTGNIYVTSNAGSTAYISKFNTSGTHQWTRSIVASGQTASLQDVTWKNNSIYLTGYVSSASGNDPMIWKLPDDGSKTGTWGSYTVASVTPTITTPTYTVSSGSYTRSARTNNVASITVTNTNTTMTSTTTTV